MEWRAKQRERGHINVHLISSLFLTLTSYFCASDCTTEASTAATVTTPFKAVAALSHSGTRFLLSEGRREGGREGGKEGGEEGEVSRHTIKRLTRIIEDVPMPAPSGVKLHHDHAFCLEDFLLQVFIIHVKVK